MILSLLAKPLAGPIATGAALLFLAFGMSQCMGRQSAEKAQHKAEKIAAAAKRDLGTCQTNRKTLEASIASRNAEIERQKAESDKRSAALTKARQIAEKEAQRADRAVSKLASFKPTGSDVCARLLAVDEVVRGAN